MHDLRKVKSDWHEDNCPIGVVSCDNGRAIILWLHAGIAPVAADVVVDIALQDQAGRVVLCLAQGRWVSPDCVRIDLPSHHGLDYWHVDQPVMYRMRGRVSTGSHSIVIDQLFGLRWYGVSQNCVQLNGKPFYIRGYIRGITAHDHPNLTEMTNSQWHASLIEKAKSFGFNFVRWHSKIPDEEFLDQADRLGMAVQVELGFRKSGSHLEVDELAWKEMVLKLCRHPSVAVYCVGNEIRQAGTYEILSRLVSHAKVLDPSALSIDNCGWGEPDRPGTDAYMQHIAYFFPYAEHERMFERVDSFQLEGDYPLDHSALNFPHRPVIAHEICHYIAMRDLENFERNWTRWKNLVQPPSDHLAFKPPKWLKALKELYESKRVLDDEPLLRLASQAFQRIAQRHSIESIRRSKALCGYQMLQFADCYKYENSNGLVDCFGQSNHWQSEDFVKFNGDTVVLAELHDRVFIQQEMIPLTIHMSHYGSKLIESGQLAVTLSDPMKNLIDSDVKTLSVIPPSTTKILAEVELCASVDSMVAQKVTLDVAVKTSDATIGNTWPIWILPDSIAPADMNECVIHTPTSNDLHAIERGARRLWLYRPEDLFDHKCSRPFLDFNGRRDLFKPVIWDRGDNLGAVVRNHPAVDWLPHEGYADWQFAPLIHHGCKINLDQFPVDVTPIVQGVDRPVRDRVEAIANGEKSLQMIHTCRKWGWLFDLAIGKGRLMVCGFNITGPHPLGRCMIHALVRSLNVLPEEPSGTIGRKVFEDYLSRCGSQPRMPEPPMTRFWLKNDEVVESKLFWEDLNYDLE